MLKNKDIVVSQLLWELKSQGLLKVMELSAAMPSRTFSADGFMEVETFFGRRMRVLASEEVSKLIAARGVWEPELCAMLINFLKPGMVFFDIGAHYGFHSLLASHIVGHRGRVHAFEPTKATYDLLIKNTCDQVNIQAHNIACWSSSGGHFLGDYGANYSAFNSFYAPRIHPQKRLEITEQKVLVKTRTIDRFVKDNALKPDFIKIDAESAEFEILKGMDKTIGQYHPIITLEVGDENIEGVCPTSDLIKHLTQRGYKPFEYKDGKILEHSLRDHYTYDNLIFLPVGDQR